MRSQTNKSRANEAMCDGYVNIHLPWIKNTSCSAEEASRVCMGTPVGGLVLPHTASVEDGRCVGSCREAATSSIVTSAHPTRRSVLLSLQTRSPSPAFLLCPLLLPVATALLTLLSCTTRTQFQGTVCSPPCFLKDPTCIWGRQPSADPSCGLRGSSPDRHAGRGRGERAWRGGQAGGWRDERAHFTVDKES